MGSKSAGYRRKRIALVLLSIMSTLLVNCVAGISQEKDLKSNKENKEEFSANVKSKPTKQPHNAKGNRDWFYTGLEINYIALNALDLVTTFYSLDRGAKEANPIVRSFVRKKPLAVLVKGGLTAGTLLGLRYVKKENRKAAYITLGLLNVMYGLVVQNNLSVYFQLKK